MRQMFLCGLILLAVQPCLQSTVGAAGTQAPITDATAHVSSVSFYGADYICDFAGRWRYHPGDNPAWAAPDFNDESWVLLNPALPRDQISDSLWPGIGWFRLHVEVDSELVGVPLGLMIYQAGASEIYLNGERLFRFGAVGATQLSEKSHIRTWSQPHTFAFEQAGRNILAVRYSNHRWYQIVLWGGEAGFSIQVGPADDVTGGYSARLLEGGRYQAFFTAFSLSLALLHLLFFIFYPKARENLFYSVLAFSFAGICYFPSQLSLITDYQPFVLHMLGFKLFLVLTAIAGPYVLYSVFYSRLPRHAVALALVGFVIMAVSWWLPLVVVYVFTFLSLGESVRVVILALYRRRPFAWIVGLGYTVFVVAAGYQLLPEFAVYVHQYQLVYYPWYMWGILALLISMSIYLARTFAGKYKLLQEHTAAAKLEAARSIEQERTEQRADIERRTQEREREYQACELEKARQLDLALHDLTEARQAVHEAQAHVVQSEKLASLGSLVAGIAHELNTPIGAVNSMHQTIVRAFANIREQLTSNDPGLVDRNDVLQRNFEAIENANRVIASGTERVMNIVRRLRNFARMDDAELKTVDIHEGLEDTLTLIHHEIKHSISVVRHYGDIPHIPCYPGQLNQVFLNLLNNARQAIIGEGTITISTSRVGDNVLISVEDTGMGIRPEHLERIFEPGFTTKGVGIGTGLGLSICRQIVEKHNGTLEVHSEPGKGTTFTVALPIDLDADTGIQRTSKRPSP